MNAMMVAIVRQLTTASGGGYLAEFPDHPGCLAHGDTAAEALAKGEVALQAWHSTQEGLSTGRCKVKWVHRPPQSLYNDMRIGAKEEGTSINAFANFLLATAIEQRRANKVAAVKSTHPSHPINPPG